MNRSPLTFRTHWVCSHLALALTTCDVIIQDARWKWPLIVHLKWEENNLCKLIRIVKWFPCGEKNFRIVLLSETCVPPQLTLLRVQHSSHRTLLECCHIRFAEWFVVLLAVHMNILYMWCYEKRHTDTRILADNASVSLWKDILVQKQITPHSVRLSKMMDLLQVSKCFPQGLVFFICCCI